MAKQRQGARRPATKRRRSGGSRAPRPSRATARLDLCRCEQFLLHEARLLDDGRFDDWLALFTPQAWYWVPSEPDQADPTETVSLIYDDRRLLETRVRRLGSPRMYSQEPRSRTSRIVDNVTIEEQDGLAPFLRGNSNAQRACVVRSKFLMVEYRREQQRIFGGTALHGLVENGGDILIAWKRVELVNCDAPLDGITIPF